MDHISEYDLGRYHLGTVELAPFEEHLMGCQVCAERAKEAAVYLDGLWAAIRSGYFDLKCGSIQ